MRLPDSSSIFTDEIWAVIKALDEIKHFSCIQIYCDTKECLFKFFYNKDIFIGYPAILVLEVRFRTTGSTNDLPRRGRPRLQRVVKTAVSWTRIFAIDSKLPLLLLLTHLAGCACTVGEMNAMLTVVFLNAIVSGVGVLSWSWQPLPMVIVHH